MEIYVLIDNQPNGPYTPELIRQYLQSGQLQPTDLAAYAGSADWQPLSVMMQSWERQAPGKGTRFASTPQTSHPKKSKAKTALAVLAVVVLLLAGGGGFAWWKLFGDSGPKVKVVTPAEPGLPNTFAELNAWYVEPPEGQNAATFFVKGFEAMQIGDEDRNSPNLPLLGKAKLPKLDAPLPAPMVKAMGNMFEKNRGFIHEVNAGSQLERSRYPMDLNQGFDALLPHLAKLKQAVQLEGIFALHRSAMKPSAPAADGIANMMVLARSLRDEPLLISQLNRSACFGITSETLEQLVNRIALPPDKLDNLAGILATTESEEVAGTGFTRATAGERASCLSILALPPEQLEAFLKKASGNSREGASDGALQSLGAKYLTKNLASQRAFAEGTFNQAMLMRKQPFPERLKVNDYFKARIEEAKGNGFQILLMLAPAIAGQQTKEATGLAHLRLMQTAIALEKYRSANGGSYPGELTALSPTFLPATPQDPFDGEALRYRKTVTGYQLYSIGPNSQDDGGQRDSGNKGDLVFEVIKAPKVIAQAATQKPTLSGVDQQGADRSDTVRRAPDGAALYAQIALARSWIERAKTGHVVVGQLAMEGGDDPVEVMAQMQILPGGFFATPVGTFDLPLAFRQHQYAPLDVSLAGQTGDFVDIGTVQMRKLPPAALRSIKGKLVLVSAEDYPKAEIRLTVPQVQGNTPGGGTSPRPRWPEGIRLKADSEGNIIGGGFSPERYYYVVTAPGYVQHRGAVSFAPPENGDMGTIELERPKRMTVDYAVLQDLSFSPASQRRLNLVTDDVWRYNSKMPGCVLTLRQIKGELFFESSCGPNRLTDLGTGTMSDFVGKISGSEAGESAFQIKLQTGHVYLFTVPAREDSQRVLFRVEAIAEMAPAEYSGTSAKASPHAQLQQLKTDLESGKINQQEYDQKKDEILKSL